MEYQSLDAKSQQFFFNDMQQSWVENKTKKNEHFSPHTIGPVLIA